MLCLHVKMKWSTARLVLAGYYLNLDYSAKLFVLTFILVVLGSNHASGECHSLPFTQPNTAVKSKLCTCCPLSTCIVVR